MTISALLMAMLLFFLYLYNVKNREPAGNIKAYFHLYHDPAKESLRGILHNFSASHPDIQVESRILPYQDMKKALAEDLGSPTGGSDELILTVLADTDIPRNEEWSGAFAPWTGDTWGLYYNSERLAEAGYTGGEPAELAKSDFDTFVDSLRSAAEGEEVLFYVGAEYSWPWLAWIQHLQLEGLPEGIQEGEGPGDYSPAAYRTGLERWDLLVENGLINADFVSAGLADSYYSISRGRALFVLSDSKIYDAYLPSERGQILSLPFPGLARRGLRVGSSFSLGLIYSEDTSSRTIAAGKLLINYLRSEEVRTSFLRSTGIPLLSAPTGEESIEEVPSITRMVRDPELMDLLEYLK